MVIFTPKHELLRALHQALRPATYLETGVQFGLSLHLATANCYAVGIDPDPHGVAYTRLGSRHQIYPMTSREYFAQIEPPALDFAFIDGMHLIEEAWFDFVSITRYAHAGTVVAIDDVLPRNQMEARRQPNPGDWTGDVWKIIPILRDIERTSGLRMTLVDVEPTGLLLVDGFCRPGSAGVPITGLDDDVMGDILVPDDILARKGAVSPTNAIKLITEGRTT
jgi:predicted O-methyltransferase YrrM